MKPPLTFSDFAALLREFIHCQPLAAAVVARDDAGFNQLALSLFTLQFVHNAPYRRFCEARGVTPQSVHRWQGIPAMPSAAFKEFELTSLDPGQRIRVFHSSGTTGQRTSRHFHSPESLSLYEASLLPWFRAHMRATSLLPLLGERAGVRASNNSNSAPQNTAEHQPHFVSLTPPPEQAPNSSLVHMFVTIHRELGSADSVFTGLVREDGVWELDLDKTTAALRASISSGHPIMLMGTAFNFVHLLDHLEQTGARAQLPPGSRVLETGGYKGRSRTLPKAELHRLIHQRLGVPTGHIISEYGMSELGSQAYEFPQPGSEKTFRFPPWTRTQIISPETGVEAAVGETGLLRIHDLANVWSVLAVQTEDLAVRRADGFELLGRAPEAELRGCSLMSA